MKTIHIIVKGNVQGVGFRGTAQHHAQKMGIKGGVKNLSNGSVEIYAQGESSDLEEFVRTIEKDCGLAKIEHISVDECKIQKEYEDFKIIF